MIDWYYHAPGEGRVGPLSADGLRKRYQDRVIRPDTLVWHDGLPEWQPLQRVAAEIGLGRLRQDATFPPPLPNVAAALPAAPPARAVARGKYSRAPLRRKKTLAPGAIALIVIAIIAIPGVMIMASVMLPNYKDYARRATRLGAIEGLSNGLKEVVTDHVVRTGRCPDNEDARLQTLRREIRTRFSMDVRFTGTGNACAFEVAIEADGESIHGKALRFEGRPSASGFTWVCRGGDMPRPYRPIECRAGG
jgi:type IV pilus assembly protein PilA